MGEAEAKEKVDRQSLYGFEMRVPDNRRSDRKGTHNIQQLWQRSHEIIGLGLQGHKQCEIAKMLNLTPETVSHTLNSDLGIEKLAGMREKRDGEFIEVSKEINRLQEKAIRVYEEIFDSDTISYNLKKSTADTVTMDLGGHRVPTRIDSRSISTTASLDEIEEFKKRGIAAAQEAGMLIEIPKEQITEIVK